MGPLSPVMFRRSKLRVRSSHLRKREEGRSPRRSHVGIRLFSEHIGAWRQSQKQARGAAQRARLLGDGTLRSQLVPGIVSLFCPKNARLTVLSGSTSHALKLLRLHVVGAETLRTGPALTRRRCANYQRSRATRSSLSDFALFPEGDVVSSCPLCDSLSFRLYPVLHEQTSCLGRILGTLLPRKIILATLTLATTVQTFVCVPLKLFRVRTECGLSLSPGWAPASRNVRLRP
ncbi:hypothetical protein MRX96_015174 [Rhipicephalus microplus]